MKMAICHPARTWHGAGLCRSCYCREYRKSGRRKPTPPGYTSWIEMRRRCRATHRKEYETWGGRGVRVCERWESFEAFIADMGTPPTSQHSIDRIDTNGDYEPGNCRWATRLGQQRNKRNNVLIEVDGVRKTASEWAETTGIQAGTIRYRKQAGWSDAETLSAIDHSTRNTGPLSTRSGQ